MRVLFHGGPLDRCTADWEDPPLVWRHMIPEELSLMAVEVPATLEVRTSKIATYIGSEMVLPDFTGRVPPPLRERLMFYVLEDIS